MEKLRKKELLFAISVFLGIIFTGIGFKMYYIYNSLFAGFVVGIGVALICTSGVIVGKYEKEKKLWYN